jgi:hypothetical protein
MELDKTIPDDLIYQSATASPAGVVPTYGHRQMMRRNTG